MKHFSIEQKHVGNLLYHFDVDVKSTIHFDSKKAKNIHYLVLKLVCSDNVFSHFHPKHEDRFLMAYMSGEITTHQLPYQRLIEACRLFLRYVPEARGVMHDWNTAKYHIQQMDYILGVVKSMYIDYNTLVRLRPHVISLLNYIQY